MKIIIPCPFCGASDCLSAYHELSLYTLSLRDPYFIHQHIVDAYAAQHAAQNLKPITNAFALIGLYLFVEKGYTGKQVQDAHKFLADRKKDWPLFDISKEKAKLNVADVLKVQPGPERDEMIKGWTRAVWEIWKNKKGEIENLFEPFELSHLKKS